MIDDYSDLRYVALDQDEDLGDRADRAYDEWRDNLIAPSMVARAATHDYVGRAHGAPVWKRKRNSAVANPVAYAKARSTLEPNSGCWLWLGSVGAYGYPEAFFGRRSRGGHPKPDPVMRWLIDCPPGSQRHHTCGNKLCVNPEHLKILTTGEHVSEHNAPGGKCKRGHNDWYNRNNGKRECRPCTLERNRQWRRKQ